VITAHIRRDKRDQQNAKSQKSIMTIQVFCDTPPCRLVKSYRRFEGALGLDLHGQPAQESTSKMTVQHSLHHVLEALRKNTSCSHVIDVEPSPTYSLGMRGKELLTKLSQCSEGR